MEKLLKKKVNKEKSLERGKEALEKAKEGTLMKEFEKKAKIMSLQDNE